MPAKGFRGISRRDLLRSAGVVAAAMIPVACGSSANPGVGPDLTGLDATVRPQDDLYRHTNGQWLRAYKLPDDQPVCSAMTDAMHRVERQLRDIIEGIREPVPATAEQQIRDLYAACLDNSAIERLGMTPLADLFADIDAAETKSELARVMGRLPIPGLIAIYVDIDRKDSRRYLATLAQSGLGMDSRYYRDPEFNTHLDAYRRYLERVAGASGLADPAGVSTRVVELERRLAMAHCDAVQDQDAAATYNLLSWSELRGLAPDFDFDAWLSGQTTQPLELFARVVVRQPSFVAAAGALWAGVDLAQWREYLRLNVIQGFSRFLPEAIATANFDFRHRFMGGTDRPDQPWQRAIATVNAELGPQLGKLYVAKHFPPAAKDRMHDLVDDLLVAYRAHFRESSWMSEATRTRAIAKLDKIETLIGSPDRWPDYSSVPITPDRLIESLRAVRDFTARRQFERLSTAVDKSEWTTTPQTVNAFYTPTSNQIVFPAAFLQPPYFDKDADPAANYGAIGAIIGHEIGHGFDDQGSEYDGDGNLSDWWAPADRAAFDAKTRQLVGQYDGLVPEGFDAAHHVDGRLTVSENLADLLGLQVAVAAYRRAARRRGEPPEFRTLFLSWARCWRMKQTDQFAMAALAANTHAPAEFRTNQIVRNIPEFYSAFEVTHGDRLFLPEEQRLAL
ncbi:M13 family metallopeptidase [Nocardia sp. NPDC057030]|uniref:M13 family metallopeptidase n=1 Tax=unclassified Nocardia TaxID=2637762 RepID=UPI00362EEFD0